MSNKITIGISACLLGQQVRFDGGHKKDKYINGTLSRYFNFIACCPEVAIGMGTPRPTIHLEGDVDNPRVVGVHDKALDVTDKLKNYSKQQCQQLPQLCGYILKSKSPSCGMERVRVYISKNKVLSNGTGVFANELKKQHPYLPTEEEGRLHDPILRENFITRVYTLHRWHSLMQDDITAKKIIEFHTQHKLLLLSHNPKQHKVLGAMVANIDKKNIIDFAQQYIAELLSALRYKSTPTKHMNAMLHGVGYIKKQLSAHDKKEFINLLENYKNREVPLIVPMTMLKHFFSHYQNDYIANQVYFEPYPSSLSLRNQI
jgi:uncharacterized protein YbgA (DUF1722 family)/uncharacterized protein YbbK (DUF523 family)